MIIAQKYFSRISETCPCPLSHTPIVRLTRRAEVNFRIPAPYSVAKYLAEHGFAVVFEFVVVAGMQLLNVDRGHVPRSQTDHLASNAVQYDTRCLVVAEKNR